jgi:predicted amidohydrolase
LIVDYKLGEYNIKVFPEGHTCYPKCLTREGFISIGGLYNKKLEVVMIDDKNNILDRRGKVVLTKEDREYGREASNDFRAFKLGKYTILPVICYEIYFPHIWKTVRHTVDKVHLIVNIVGRPMYNQNQAEKWRGLQLSMTSYYECDLVCSVGKGKGIDISGVIEWKNQ